MHCRKTLACLAVLSALHAGPSLAHDGEHDAVDEVVVYGRAQSLLGTAQSASEGLVGYADLELAPLLRVGELVEAVPGMVATQHSGTGKANQYFLRGFNLDHGTDFSASVDGVPVNMRTHGHGQGYLDLNFLIPELVESVTYRKGPYSAKAGDFSSAGSAAFELYGELDENTVRVSVGEFQHMRGLAAGSFELGAAAVTGALDVTSYSGPWEIDEDLEQLRLHLGVATPFLGLVGKLTLQGYSGTWNSTDQVPRRAVDAGLIDRLGFIDPDLGGSTDRYSLTGSISSETWTATLYVVDYDFSLFSNFTYLLEDPDGGDQFEQVDNRQIYGAKLDGHYHWANLALPTTLRWGGDVRIDDIEEVGLFTTTARQRTGVVRQDAVDQRSASAYAELTVAVTDRLRTSIGTRIDYFDWDVDARLAENSGSGDDALTSPGISVAWRVSESTELYANWGRGFHSNDVRGTTISIDPRSGDPASRVAALVASEGAEIGARIEPSERFSATATLFQLDLDSELVFVGDGGATEPNAASERVGLELATFVQANDWLAANLEYTRVNAEFVSGEEIPGAVEETLSLGLNAAFDNRVFASARLRYLGDAPLIEDGSVRSDDSLLVNASLGYRWDRAELRLDAFNLLDSNDDDIAYYYASRLAGESAAGIEDVHFHPLEPRSLRLSLAYRW
ncbi:MAG: TonB-dependent receptor [Woeseiaceae bacterium]|nr:TonB-dependent receptor [Woeseiaceae bacterium]